MFRLLHVESIAELNGLGESFKPIDADGQVNRFDPDGTLPDFDVKAVQIDAGIDRIKGPGSPAPSSPGRRATESCHQNPPSDPVSRSLAHRRGGRIQALESKV